MTTKAEHLKSFQRALLGYTAHQINFLPSMFVLCNTSNSCQISTKLKDRLHVQELDSDFHLPLTSLAGPTVKWSHHLGTVTLEDNETKTITLNNGPRAAFRNKLRSQCVIGVIVSSSPFCEVNRISGAPRYP